MLQDKNLLNENSVAPFGQFLGATSIDEIQQLFNVLIGDMSLIGPRQLFVEYNGHFDKEQNKILKAGPGISGLAQVKGRNTLSWNDKFALDVKYVENISFIEDVKIFMLTLLVALKSSGFKKSGEANTFTESIDEE